MSAVAGSKLSATASSSPDAKALKPSSSTESTATRWISPSAEIEPGGKTSMTRSLSTKRARSIPWRSSNTWRPRTRRSWVRSAGAVSKSAWENRFTPPPRSPPLLRSSIHCATGLSGTVPTADPGSSASTSGLSCSRCADSASAATDLWSKTSRGEMITPASRARATNWMDMMLSPPSSKNESCTPTASRPRTCANRAARRFSVSVRGGRSGVAADEKSGVGSAARSSFP